MTSPRKPTTDELEALRRLGIPADKIRKLAHDVRYEGGFATPDRPDYTLYFTSQMGTEHQATLCELPDGFFEVTLLEGLLSLDGTQRERQFRALWDLSQTLNPRQDGPIALPEYDDGIDDATSDILTRMSKLRTRINKHMDEGEWGKAKELVDEYEALSEKLTELDDEEER